MNTTTPLKTFGISHGVCRVCGALVPARVEADAAGVWLRVFCTEHGEHRALVRSDAEDYARTLRFVKPASVPAAFAGDAALGCPDGCGFCERHEQHLCMPIIEITGRCDLACPICINASGGDGIASLVGHGDLEPAVFSRMLDRLLEAEPQIDVLNLSGGEPLLHPQVLELVDLALARPEIVRVSISTNGMELLRQPGLLPELKRRGVVVSLQFDGFSDEVYQTLRGRPLLAEKQRILALLKEHDVTTSLTMTVAAGVNEAELPAVLELLFAEPQIISLMLQPVAFTGRGAALIDGARRVTIPDLVRWIGESGVRGVAAADFVPLPCSHPLCFSLAFYLALEGGGVISINRLADAATLMDSLANKVVFGLDPSEHEKLKALIYELWSGPAGAVPEAPAVLKTLKGILKEMAAPVPGACGCFDPRRLFRTTERHVKSIFIHAFMDAETFDLARLRRCCQAYPQPDGRLLPACARNVVRQERV
jgi:uncharacterized radical SAM superfamily Fe-S cluster-containing enzyme